MPTSEMTPAKHAILAHVDALKSALIAIADDIFDHPELGYQEVRASKSLGDFLAAHGFSVEHGVAGLPTAFCARYSKGKGPKIAFLAEYDALPSLGHACGHNLFGTASVAAGIALAREMPCGTVYVFGTPAEEGAVDNAGGKAVMADAGLFDGIDAALTCHAEGRTILQQDLISRAVLEMDFYGKAAHAAGAPEKGVNALSAAVFTVNAINALREHMTSDVRIHGIIADGGRMINTIPDFTRLQYGVRARHTDTLELMVEKVLNCARGAALATDCRLEYRHKARPYYTMRHNPTLLEAFAANLTLLDEPYIPHVASSYSTDVGNVSLKIPTIHPYISIGGEHLVGHTPAFADACHAESGYAGMLLAAKSMALTGLDVLENPALCARIHDAFAAEE